MTEPSPAPSPSLRSKTRTVALIVATAAFMQNLDSSVTAIALPSIAADFGSSPIHLKLVITSYLLALAIFIPASGWIADRFGARNVFRAAMMVFALGSIACGLSQGLGSLVAARVLQGLGGAMMVPVGRLVILRATPKSELVSVMAWLTMPAVIGPVVGPVIGGALTTFLDWRWIFWINIPVAILGVALAGRFIPDVRGDEKAPFDLVGFLLIGPGLALALTGSTVAGLGFVPPAFSAMLILVGVALLVVYVLHALRRDASLVDLRLLRIVTFRACILGGMLFRIGAGALPFLVPLLLQIGFGMTAFEAGALTFTGALGALSMKALVLPIVGRFGYRNVLLANTVFASLLIAVPALFIAATPWPAIAFALLAGGFARSLQFTSISTLAYADIPAERIGRASTFVAVQQELTGSIGVSVAALGLESMQGWRGDAALATEHFAPVFVAVAAIAITSIAIFARLPKDAGNELVARKPRRD